MKRRERLFWAAFVLLCTCGLYSTVTSCAASVSNQRQAEEVLRQEPEDELARFRELIAAYDAALEDGDEELIESTRRELEAYEDERARKRAEEGGELVGGLAGGFLGMGPLGSAIGLLAARELAPMVLTKRGRKLLRKAARQGSVRRHPDAPNRLDIFGALDTLRRASGWGHSTPQSEAVAEKSLEAPAPASVVPARDVRGF